MHDYSNETIHIENLRVQCIIGVHPHERKQPQPLVISASFPSDFSRPGESGRLEDTVDYSAMAQAIRDFARAGQYQLLETLARRLAEHVGQRFGLARLHLHIRKPEAIGESDGAAVSLDWRHGQEQGP